jgi:hypothetical protein
LVVRRAGWVIAIALALAVAGGYYASNLPANIETDYARLIPDDLPTAQALDRINQTIGGEGSDLAVGIVSPSFEANKAFAEDLIPQAKALTREDTDERHFRTVEYRRDTEFMENHALYFATDREIQRIQETLSNRIEEAKLEANPFFVDIGGEDDDAAREMEVEAIDSLYTRLIGTEYPISDDSTTMTVRFFPSGAQTDLDYIRNLYDEFGDLVDRMNPESYHSEMEITLAGRLLRRQVQVESVQNDVAKTFGSGAAAVILLVVSYFLYKSYRAQAGATFSFRVLLFELVRFPVLTLVIAVPLLMSLTWTFGVTYLAIGSLNLMTSTLALLLFGLGVDFGVHFYGRYAEERSDNKSIIDAAETTFVHTGQAITVGAMTTASALLVLTFAEFKGFSEFGLIAGYGIIFANIAMIVVLPALLSVFERAGVLNLAGIERDTSEDGSDGQRFPAARPILVVSAVAVVASIVLIPRVSFEYDFGELEPDYPEYERKDEIVDRVSSSRAGSNPAYILTESPEETAEVASILRERARKDTVSPTIKEVQTLQERYPLREDEEQERLRMIANVREQLQSKYLENNDSKWIERLRQASQVTRPVAVEEVPEYLQDTFTTQTGEVGTFVMVYPSVEVSNGRQSMAFAEDVRTVRTNDGKVYHAGSTQLIGAEVLRLMQEESPWMVAAVLGVVMILMITFFQSIRWAAVALIPLVVGMLWMLLTIEFFGPKLNLFNLVVLPAMLGIGNDDGIHMVQRYREEGPNSIMTVFRSKGEHCTIGSLTTMIGFFGLLLSYHPGLVTIGQLALIGVTTTLLAALGFLPALLQWLEDRSILTADDRT